MTFAEVMKFLKEIREKKTAEKFFLTLKATFIQSFISLFEKSSAQQMKKNIVELWTKQQN